MYTPIKSTAQKKTSVTSLMAKKGVNLRDLPQLSGTDFALSNINYFITSDGGLIKRKGYTVEHSVVGGSKITLVDKYKSNLYIYAYADKLALYDKLSGTASIIKTYSGNRVCNGVRYGDYYFVTNGQDSLVMVSTTLAYDGQTVNYTLGKKVTGSTSGATGIILQDADAGATGVLTLGDVSGTFLNDEPLVDESGGTAVVNGTLGYTCTDVTNAPIGSVIQVIGARLYIGNLKTDSTAVAYSYIDSGTNPPFASWTVSTDSEKGGLVNYRNAGTVNSIRSLGNNVVVFAEDGKWAFTITTKEIGTTLSKVDDVIIDREDMGGSRGSLVTPEGLFYVNEGGLWQLVSLGQSDIPYSDQEGQTSVLLGTQYFDNIDLSDCDMVYYDRYNTLLITCAKDSATNNLIIAYNTENKSFSTFTGWNITRFMKDTDIYAGSSRSTEIFKLFDSYQDNTSDIWTEFYQEITLGDLETSQMLYGGWMQGYLSPSTELTVSFDIYDVNGNLINNKLQLLWTAQTSAGGVDGFGSASWGTSAWGGDSDVSGIIESFDGFRNFIRNFQRLRIKITSHDKLPHQINWVKLEARPKTQIRRRKITTL